MNTTTTTPVITARELVAAMPIVILARALLEAVGAGERRFVMGQPARA